MKHFGNLILCLTVLICGCASRSAVSVNIVNVRFTEMTALETTALFTLRFSNESPEPVQFTGGVYKIYINNLYVGEGLTSESIELPRLGTATQEVTVHMSNIALATRLKSIIESQSFDYRVESVLHSKSWMDRMRSVSEGRLDMKDFTPTPESTNATTM
jgi:LEA14-like dessication related protein